MSWAFSDESERAGRMMFGIAFVEAQKTYEIRRELRSLLLPGQRRVHMAKEGARRRRAVLDAIVGLALPVTVFELRRPSGLSRPDARAVLLSKSIDLVSERKARFWVLDNMEESQIRRDELQLHSAGTAAVFDHRHSHEEPLLWIVDVVLWAYGAGGDWKRRAESVTEVHRIEP